jgi:hypothetical protein
LINFQFTSASNTSSTINGPVVEFTLGQTDINQITRIPELASRFENAYVELLNSTIDDMAGNSNQQKVKHVKQYFHDTTAPELVSFSFNMTSEPVLLELSFYETVNASTLVASGITFKADGTSSSVTLTDGAVTSAEYSTSVTFALVDADVDRITAFDDLATTEGNTVIELANNAIKDMAGNPVVTAAKTAKTGAYQADAKKPTLLSYILNMDSLELSLEFSETVNATSLAQSLKSKKITFQDTSLTASATSTHSLSGGKISYTTTDSTRVNVTLTADDANAIKLLRGLAIAGADNTFMVFVKDTIADMAGNGIAAVTVGVPPANVVADTTDPALELFELDMNAGVLTLSFSEAMEADSLLVHNFTIQSTSNLSSGVGLQLTGGARGSTDGLTLYINLTDTDMNELKRVTTLAASNETA